MVLTIHEQLKNSIQNAKRILVVTRPLPEGAPPLTFADGLGAGLALCQFLKRCGKNVDFVAPGYGRHSRFAFLPEIASAQNDLQNAQKFVIKLNVADTKISDLRYEMKDGELRIHITPKYGEINPEKLATHAEDFSYDLMITLDTPDLGSLGSLYEKNVKLFSSTPVINIDSRAENEQYGAVNAVDTTASSTCEVVFSHLEQMDRALIDAHIATCLLTGLVTKTKCFQKTRSPKTFEAASRLISLGARREEVMQQLYRNRSLASFRLWGTVLANLNHDETKKFTWVALTARDFLSTGGSEDELPAVVEELILDTPETNTVLILYEKTTPGELCGLLFSTAILDTQALLNSIVSWDRVRQDNLITSPGFIRFCIKEDDIARAEDKIVEMIKKNLYTA
ncbi:MAG: DHH family phosphoesterase [Patescibacteria group bacterium]